MALPTDLAKTASEPPTLLSSVSSACLQFLAEHPDASGSGVRDGLCMHHLSQASRLLARLERDGLVEKQRGGRENHWRLTDRGQTVLREQDRMLSDGSAPAQPSVNTNPPKGART